MDLNEALKDHIVRRCGMPFRLKRLQGDASTRHYYRASGGDGTCIVCLDPLAAGDDEYVYETVYGIFQERGLPVPELHMRDQREGVLILQDCGDTLLEDVFLQMPQDELETVYRELLQCIIKIQQVKPSDYPSITGPPFSLVFDSEKLLYELDFFIQHMVKNFLGVDIPSSLEQELVSSFRKLASVLDSPSYFVLTHRDFHSRNVMLHEDNIYIIDFQDARMGLPQYDVASLLRDSYAGFEDSFFERLLFYYYQQSRDAGVHSFSWDEFCCFFDHMAFQRNLKALGTFGYQSSVMGNDIYERYIPRTFSYLAGYASRYELLEKIHDLLREIAGDAM
ncbi:MAG: aminoglycoside phosphotransferase family protein [Spirochaetota bacterium]